MRVDIARSAIAVARGSLLDGQEANAAALAQATAERFLKSRQRAVLNATGVLLHTNLGRAPLHPEAVTAATEAGLGYTNLELDLTTGQRGGRNHHLTEQLRVLTGAEAAMVVNNNAGALFLTLTALAAGRRVPVSRGELIEIGGSYRLPELMAASTATLVEVGTTNRTRIADHRRAIDEDTAMLLKVHPSNYRIEGFTEEASLADMVGLAADTGLPLVFDIGSGLIDERVPWIKGPPPDWVGGEPGVVQAIELGVDLVMFSGDKLLGGPQAGLIVGRRDLISQLRAHPIARAMRTDGLTAAALDATLGLYVDGRAAEIPFWAMATTDPAALQRRIEWLLGEGVPGEMVAGTSTVGAGSVPGSEISSPLIRLDTDADRSFLALLEGSPPVVGRRDSGRLLVDLRTVPPEADDELRTALLAACR
jgi:L-seryl-tRNA(Ser) seleniumtransferase